MSGARPGSAVTITHLPDGTWNFAINPADEITTAKLAGLLEVDQDEAKYRYMVWTQKRGTADADA